MAKITPFNGLRPRPELAARVATLPYDVVSTEEARRYRDQEYNFYHVTRSEIDLPEGTDPHSQQVYDKAKENLDNMLEMGILRSDPDPCYYIYELHMNGRSQTGLICASSVNDYLSGVIKKHEHTRPEKEQDRINHMIATKAQTGVVFLAYRDNETVQKIIERWKEKHQPVNNFVAPDGVRHTLWVMDDYAKCATITRLFHEEVPATYIADGHHRAASAAKVCLQWRELGYAISGEEAFNYFLTCIFPASQLEILPYNRVVTDLNKLTPVAFLKKLEKDFVVEKIDGHPVQPAVPHEMGMYLNGSWYRLTARPGSYPEALIPSLDCSILQDNVLSKILDIHNPRTDSRVDFVGGIRGLGELERRVDQGAAVAAFSLYPVSIDALLSVADSGEVMPPKSTWFEPKLRDGLVVYPV